MKLPIILYNIQKQVVNKYQIIKSNCFYFYSYQNFDIEIIDGIGSIFSVTENNSVLQTLEAQSHTGNYGYTIYIPNNNSLVKIKVSTDTEEIIYNFELKLDNIIDDSNEHYLDYLSNFNLPTFKEIESSIPIAFDRSELIKRLLIDFRRILIHKGTKQSIDAFFEFLGFDDENLTVYDEYTTKDGKLTTVPNKEIDIKSAIYRILYNNYTEENAGLDSDNLPIRKILIQDLEDFSNKLLNAISLANKYFTSEEQEIRFFGLCYSSNLAKKLSITSNMSMIFENDTFGFRKNLHINVDNYLNSVEKFKLVENCLLRNSTLYKSEIKILLSTPKPNNEIYFIDREIFDDETQEIDNVERLFACCFHLTIKSPNTYVSFELSNVINPFSKLTFKKEFIVDKLEKIIVVSKTARYLLKIWVTDAYNNTEYYFYNFNVDNNIQRIDFNTFNSTELLSDAQKNINNINIDIDAPTQLRLRESFDSTNFIVPLNSIPNDLSNYFNVIVNNYTFGWLSTNDRYILPDINGNFKVDDITESIPVELIDNWLEIITFKYYPGLKLMLRVLDETTYEEKLIEINEIGDYNPNFDKLYVTIIDIYDRDADNNLQSFKTPYYFITTIESGIDFTKESYDFVLIDLNEPLNEPISIYSMDIDSELFINKIPVNYDFPLFPIASSLVPTNQFTPYISNNSEIYKEIFKDSNDLNVELPVIKSIFPRLIDISKSEQGDIDTISDTYYLKLGDVIVCRLNKNYVVNERNINWKILNSFTNEILFESNEYTLKYRIDDNICYDIICNFEIDGTSYVIKKKSLFSSFLINNQ